MSVADEIRKLYELHQSGALTDDEFATLKASLLSKTQSPPPSVSERLPDATAPRTPSVAPVVSRGASAEPSVALLRMADAALIWGCLSIVLGWTVFVPAIGVDRYSDAAKQAKKEDVPVPAKATVGLLLALLFGIVQTLTMARQILRNI